MRTNNRPALSHEQKTKSLLGRILWFGLGLLSAITYNQLTWQYSTIPTLHQAAVMQADVNVKEEEDEQLDRILDEIQSVRRDYQRMKASRDLTRERLDQCQALCPKAKDSR
jgi:ATP phosphoribosyltransferase